MHKKQAGRERKKEEELLSRSSQPGRPGREGALGDFSINVDDRDREEEQRE